MAIDRHSIRQCSSASAASAKKLLLTSLLTASSTSHVLLQLTSTLQLTLRQPVTSGVHLQKLAFAQHQMPLVLSQRLASLVGQLQCLSEAFASAATSAALAVFFLVMLCSAATTGKILWNATWSFASACYEMVVSLLQKIVSHRINADTRLCQAVKRLLPSALSAIACPWLHGRDGIQSWIM